MDNFTQRRLKEVKLPKGVTKIRVYYINDPYYQDERVYFSYGDTFINGMQLGHIEEYLKNNGLLNDKEPVVLYYNYLTIFDSANAIKWYDTKKQKNMPPPIAPFTLKALDNDYIFGDGTWKKGNAISGGACTYKCTVGITPEKTYKIMSLGPRRDPQYGFFLYYGPEVKNDVVDIEDY